MEQSEQVGFDRWQRWLFGLAGVSALSVAAVTVFTTDNDVAIAAFLAVGFLLIYLAISGQRLRSVSAGSFGGELEAALHQAEILTESVESAVDVTRERRDQMPPEVVAELDEALGSAVVEEQVLSSVARVPAGRRYEVNRVDSNAVWSLLRSCVPSGAEVILNWTAPSYLESHERFVADFVIEIGAMRIVGEAKFATGPGVEPFLRNAARQVLLQASASGQRFDGALVLGIDLGDSTVGLVGSYRDPDSTRVAIVMIDPNRRNESKRALKSALDALVV